jgi:hypothetical protein
VAGGTQQRRELQRRATLVLTNVRTGQFKVVENLRVTFTIKKSHRTVQNRGTITVFNLSEETRRFVRESRDRSGNYYIFVELNAWLQQGDKPQKPLFRGRCVPFSEHRRPEWVTTFEGIDSAINFRNFSFERNYRAGTRIRTIINELARESGIPALKIDGRIKGSLKKDRTFSGPPINILLDLKSDYGFTFDIQDRTLIARAPLPLPTNPLKVNSGTGMIGTPKIRAGLLIVRVLIDQEILPDTFIQVSSLREPDTNGIYIVRKTTTQGDNWSGNWTIEIEAAAVDVPSLYYMQESEGLL